MQFSNTTTKNGILQDCEFWTNLGDAGISGNATNLARFTNRINRRYERAMSMANGTSRIAQTDDTNYTNQPFSYFDITSGQNDYQFLTDADGNSITDITAVLILQSSTATDYVKLDALTLDEVNNRNNGVSSGHLYGSNADNPELILSPNASNSGIPTGYLERNNTIFFDVVPNYAKTNGGKLFYKRVPSYFLSSDTTKQPGFSAEHHQILSLGASLDWLLVYQPEKQVLITRIENELSKLEKEFKTYCDMRNPIRRRMTGFISDTK